MKIVKILLGYWVEILMGIIILLATDDIRWFLFYFLIIFLVSSELRIDYIRKLVRVYQVMNEGKLISIIRKLGITNEELQKLGDETENNLTEEQRKSLYEDMDSLGLK